MAGEDTDPKSSASAAAVPYVFFLFLLEALLQFLVLVFSLDMLGSISCMQLAILSTLDMFSYGSYMNIVGGWIRHMPKDGLSWWERVERRRCLEAG